MRSGWADDRREECFPAVLQYKKRHHATAGGKEYDMETRKMKKRVIALGLAFLMGLSPFGSAVTYASENNTESVEAEAEVVISPDTAGIEAKSSVTAEDITKDVSDDTFVVEDCMEGIIYDASTEEVTLAGIEAEGGGAYHPDQAGTF